MQNLVALIEKTNVNQENLVGYLPNTLRALCPELSVKKIVAMVETIGGRQLWIPKKIDLGPELCRLLSEHSTKKLIMEYGGKCLTIPKAYKLELHLKKIIMVELRDKGMSFGYIAAQFNITDRSVYN